MTADTITLPVELVGWHWAMSRRRTRSRRSNPGDVAGRWLRRYVQRHAVTLTEDPVVSLVPDCVEHWHRGYLCLTISAHAVIGGQRFGLPERLDTRLEAVLLPVIDS